jgi:hypothetical protein
MIVSSIAALIVVLHALVTVATRHRCKRPRWGSRSSLAVVLLTILAGSHAAQAGGASAQFQVGMVICKICKPKPLQPPAAQVRYTPGAAALSVEFAGFKVLRTVAITPDVYWFDASSPAGTVRVAVSAANGAIIGTYR